MSISMNPLTKGYHLIETSKLNESQVSALFQLWNQEYPANVGFNNIRDFQTYLEGLQNPNHVLMTDQQGQIIGWAFSFDRDEVRWFAILVSTSAQHQGLGSRLLDVLKSGNNHLSGWVIDHDRDVKRDGHPYLSPLAFYIKNGFNVIHDIRFELDIISAVKITWSNA